jgi:hypothetical protein
VPAFAGDAGSQKALPLQMHVDGQGPTVVTYETKELRLACLAANEPLSSSKQGNLQMFA